MWGFYALAFSVSGGNNVISDCQEYSLNLTLGGSYEFVHCTFSNFWTNDKPREKQTININNYNDVQEIPMYTYFGNCIIDGKLTNELNIDLKTAFTPTLVFSNSWIKTDMDISDANRYINVKKDNTSLKYKDIDKEDFEPDNEDRNRGFVHPKATTDANFFKQDIKGTTRNTASVTAGAYEFQ